MAKKDSGETALYLLAEHMYVSGFNNLYNLDDTWLTAPDGLIL
jgi:hypothetical protein